MKKLLIRPTGRLSIITTAAVVLIVVLQGMAKIRWSGDSGFRRVFPPAFVEAMKGIDLKYTKYYLAGSDEKNIYLGNYSATAHVLRVDENLADTLHISLRTNKSTRIAWGMMKVGVMNDEFILMDRQTPGIVVCDTTGEEKQHIVLPSVTVVEMMPSGARQLFIKTYDPLLKKTSIQQHDLSPRLATDKSVSLAKQSDGFFCCDGMMVKNENNQLIYVYRYRNRFDVFDDRLNMISSGSTIDTNGMAKVSVKTVNGTTTFDAPPLVINKLACADKDNLFVCSAISADNEDQLNIRDNNVIDRYDLRNGKYISSLYLPKYKKQKLTGMLVRGHLLYAMYETDMYLFRIKR